VEINNNHSLY